MIEIRIDTIHHKGPAYVIDPTVNPEDFNSQTWSDMAVLKDVLFSGPAVLVNPLLRRSQIANLARSLGPTAMSDVFYLQTRQRMMPSTVIPLESEAKSVGTELVDRISFDVLGTAPHIIRGKNATRFLT